MTCSYLQLINKAVRNLLLVLSMIYYVLLLLMTKGGY